MDDARLTASLAARILGWRLGGDGRWLLPGGQRRWLSPSRFAPTTNIKAALELLDRAGADFIVARRRGAVVADVTVAGVTGRASGQSLAFVLCQALARALGLYREAA